MAGNLDEKIKNLLGSGLSNEIVASTIGCHPSYISQLMSDENFYSAVIEKRTQTLASHTIRDRNLDGIEDKLIAKLSELIESNMVYKPQDLLRMFAVINAAKRRGVGVQDSTVVNNTVVNLQISRTVKTKFTTNAQNEVVEIEGKSMVTMPAAQLLGKLAASAKGDNATKYIEAARFIPQEPGGKESIPLLEAAAIEEPANDQHSGNSPQDYRERALLARLKKAR